MAGKALRVRVSLLRVQVLLEKFLQGSVSPGGDGAWPAEWRVGELL